MAGNKNSGRKPKPKEAPFVPSAPKGEPDKPECLGEYESRVWDKTVAALKQIKPCPLSVIDDDALRIYCEAWGLYVIAVAEIEKYGITISTEKSVIKNPAVTVRADAMKDIQRGMQQFGLSPVDRQSLKLVIENEVKKETPSDFLDEEMTATVPFQNIG